MASFGKFSHFMKRENLVKSGTMVLKPQDVLVALKLALHDGFSYPDLAQSVGLSVGEAHNAVRRLGVAQLVDVAERRPRLAALEEFLIHGVRYAFPAQRKGLTRGMVTAASAPPLHDILAENSEPLVWPHVEGKIRGWELTPLYGSVPDACLEDAQLYELMALLDAIRSGGARERQLAIGLLRERLKALKNRVGNAL